MHGSLTLSYHWSYSHGSTACENYSCGHQPKSKHTYNLVDQSTYLMIRFKHGWWGIGIDSWCHDMLYKYIIISEQHTRWQNDSNDDRPRCIMWSDKIYSGSHQMICFYLILVHEIIKILACPWNKSTMMELFLSKW